MKLAKVNKQVLDQLATNVRLGATVTLNTVNGLMYKKINDANKWYTRVIGLDEVKLYQDRVVDLQVSGFIVF